MAFVSNGALSFRTGTSLHRAVSLLPNALPRQPRMPPSPACLPRPAQMCAAKPAQTQAAVPLKQFLADAADLGTIRFIAVTPGAGAVLETIGRFDYSMATFSAPGKGDFMTLASADKTFECHINLSKARVATMGTQPAKSGDHDLHVIRLLDKDDAVLLSCMLMWDPSRGQGNYLHGAVDAFQQLRARYGDRFDLA